MSMTLEDAWREEAYEQMADEILESFRNDIIDEFVSERTAQYYRDNPDLAEAAESSLTEAKSLLRTNATASLVFSRSATEIALRDVILKPIAHGMVHDENSGPLIVELAIGNQQFAKLLFRVLEGCGLNLKSFRREGVSDNLWNEIKEISAIRNRILHRGERASEADAARSIAIATVVLKELYPSLRNQMASY